MVRTGGIVIGGTLLSFFVLGGLLWIASSLNEVGVFECYAIEVAAGAIVGGFVGWWHHKTAGMLAVLCLAPLILFQYVTPYHVGAEGLTILMVGTALQIVVTFVVALIVSKRAIGQQSVP
jgi:hypothetical protein